MMNRRGALLALVFAASAFAGEPASVEATGEAAILQGNVAQARDRATEDALRRAVEQACGTLVVAESQTRNFQLINDKILTQAKGYVSSYDVLDSKAAEGTVTVKVRAKVGTDKLADDLAAIGLVLARKGMPRLAILIWEKRFDDKAIGSGGPMGVDQRIAENALIGEWTKAGFTFVDPDVLAGKIRAAGVVSTEIGQDQAREMGAQSGADVVILGSAIATKQQDQSKLLEGISQGARDVTGVSCSATISARAFNVDNADLLATGEETAPAFNQSALSCGRDALVKSAKQFSASLQKDLLARWNRDVGSANRVRLRVSGLDSLKTLNTFKTALKDAVRGVQSVDQRSFKKGSAELDVRIQGSADAFASEIDSKKVGSLKVSVTGITANAVDIELTH